ncbi:MAG: AAA-like domain-containing protein [Fibrella sp.]|nr:AAA-like domain-containing protein [Armatimonadota bacterium]
MAISPLEFTTNFPPMESDNESVASAQDTVLPPEKVSKTIFISYRHVEPDSTLAHKLADALRQAGHTAFIDSGIRWGEDWAKRIYDSLLQCDYLLLLLSKEAANSEMVSEEVRIAVNLRRKPERPGCPLILPVRVQLPFSEPLPYELSARLSSIQQIQWTNDADTQPLIEKLLQTVGNPEEWRGDIADRKFPIESVPDYVPAAQVDPRLMRVLPGGVIRPGAPHYVVREMDNACREGVLAERGLVTLIGARQTGKTSLILRTMQTVSDTDGLRPALVDFQVFDEADFISVSHIWRRIIVEWAEELNLTWTRDQWREGASERANIGTFLQRHLFARSEIPVLLCFDEADRVITHPTGPDFFATVRGFWGLGARDAYWERIHWLIGASTEPSIFIPDLSMSPFNIGDRVETHSLTEDEVKTMASRFGQSDDAASEVYAFAGGQPYLTHTLFYQMARGTAPQVLFGTRNGGIFHVHLHRFLLRFQAEPDLRNALQGIIRGEGCPNLSLARRIELAGLARYDKEGRLVPACGLYATFFRDTLG